MLIRRAEPRDYSAVGELTVAAYVEGGHIPPAASGYLRELADTRRRAAEAEVWVAAEDGVAVGSVTWCPPGSAWREVARLGEGEFRMLAVAPGHQGRGIGEALVRHCLARSVEAGHAAMVLCSLPGQRGAHRVYERLGFVRDPTLDWQPVPGVDLWGFRLDLTAPPEP